MEGTGYIDVSDLRQTYRSVRGEVPAIEGLSFQVRREEFLAVVGPSGCGKSTLLKILAGILPYDSGRILIDGKAVGSSFRTIGFVFQRPVLFPWKTVLGNILSPVELTGLDRRSYRSNAEELIALARLDGFENRYPSELSGGMQQRVAICRALILDPQLILMDEPFGALDALTRDEMNTEILRIWQQARKTILFVTHSTSEAVFLADRVIVLSNRPCNIREIVEVNLSRPRSVEVRATQRFSQLVLKLYELLSQGQQ